MINELNKKIEIYKNSEIENVLGQIVLSEEFLKCAWANIKIKSIKDENVVDRATMSETTIIFTLRKKSIKNITRDMFFIFENERYNILYFMPHFKFKDRIEIYCEHIIS